MGNPEPIFGIRDCRLRNRPDVFKEQHFSFRRRGCDRPPAQWRGMENGRPASAPRVRRLKLAVQCELEFLQRPADPQMELLDWRPANT